jgi:hypothetical protein
MKGNCEMTILYFTKEFTGGLLKGMKLNEQMRFASEGLAIEFANKCSAPTKHAAGGSNWKIIDFSFQKYWRY